MPELRRDSPLQFVKGVGPVRAAQLAERGLHTVVDLLEYLPSRYEPHQGDQLIGSVELSGVVTVRGEVRRVRGRWPLLTCDIADGSGQCRLRWFDQRSAPRGLHVGVAVIATGEPRLYHDRLELVHPRVQIFSPDAIPPKPDGPRLRPVYRAQGPLSNDFFRTLVERILPNGPFALREGLPAALRVKHGLMTREQALHTLHAPPGQSEIDAARARLAYEQFLVLEVGLALRRRHTRSVDGQKLRVTAEIDRRIRRRFPFQLTAAQNDVLREIVRDISRQRPMTRLLQGDVGSGKTVVALYACLAVIANQRQAAIMAPTEILAGQHFAKIQQYLAGSRVRRALLRGAMPKRERTALLDQIARGNVELVVGTHALVQKDVAFQQLGLVVVDEQHKFGVEQRALVRTKGAAPHYLVMTATPIPRTLAMTVFGDLDVSVMRARPPGRGVVRTHITPSRNAPALWRTLRTRLKAGEQAYVVCPVIGEDNSAAPDAARPSSPTQMRSARQTFAALQDGPWAGLQIGLLHGGLPQPEKDAVLTAFNAGTLQAIVATTVVEVGVDVPNATIMCIEHAERFGLSQLHQLRGRVGRGGRDGDCYLLVRGGGSKAGERLRAVVETDDGFAIAEADLRQRGPGELLGTRQSGLPELRFGDLAEDFAWLEHARDDAFKLVEADPQLSRPEHRALRAAVRDMYRGKLRFLEAG